MKSIKPFGGWESALTAETLAKKGRRFGHMCLDNQILYWLEVRAEEQGRGVLMRCDAKNQAEEVLPRNISVRTKVHEYGGGDFLVANGVVYFSNAEDNRVYQFDSQLSAITPLDAGSESRFADFRLTPNGKYLLAVRESHQKTKVVNALVSICLKTQQVKVLHSGFDFYSFPRITQSGLRVSWTCWNQPDMPWDSAELWSADLHSDGSLDAAHKVSGGNGVSIFQPEWSEDDVLHYVSDTSNWSNIYSHRDGVLNALTPIDREFATPQWIFGLSTYVINQDGGLYALNYETGEQHLCHIDPSTGHIAPIKLPFNHFQGSLLGDESALYFCAASNETELAMYRFNIATKVVDTLSHISEFPLQKSDISCGKAIQFKSKNDRSCHAFYYPPQSSRFEAPANTQPPLIVISHGGPTAFSDSSLDLGIQFWTNRGFAVVDVNYAGSTGFGKKYRELLAGQWGIADVEDCVAAAQYLVAEKLADAEKLLIRGGSAGGFTTLCALTFSDVFAAGMSRYGVADLESLAGDSHKFEARYLDKLVGPYPQDKSVYKERSPIHFASQLSCPLLLLQGADDKVVPPNQAQQMVAALESKKLPYSFLLFEGEGHGFRQSATIIKAFNAELFFYRKILNIDSAENIEPIHIQHMH